MFRKVLVANRGEIAVRAFRAAYELGAQTVAVFPHEDRNSEHRLKADEAYEIGERGPPGAGLPRPRGDRRGPRSRPAPTRSTPATASSPRTRALAEACADAGITFVGPPAEVLHADRQQGPRDRRRQGRPGVPTLRVARARRPTSTTLRRRGRRASASRCSSRRSPAAAAAACAGSTTAEDLREALEAAHARGRGARSATRPSSSSRPWSTRGTSRCRSSPTAPATSIHLFERDCSVQRRHQKVVEIAPAPEPRPRAARADVRRRRARSPARSATSTPAPSSSCSTRDGRYVFIEMNPRIQVEHTVTEEVTDVDLVQSQMRIASGETLADLGPAPGRHPAARRRAAVPDHHRGPGQRLPPRHRQDHRPTAPPGGAGRPARRRHRRTPAPRSAPHFDSMLAKLTCRGRDFATAVAPRPPRARGVPDPRRLHQHPVPAGGARRPRLRRRATSPPSFIDERPAAADRPRRRPTAAPSC